MEELSWRARLAKSNINILSIDPAASIMVVEFTYHPKPGVFKWCKTAFPYIKEWDLADTAESLLRNVLDLRKELEG